MYSRIEGIERLRTNIILIILVVENEDRIPQMLIVGIDSIPYGVQLVFG